MQWGTEEACTDRTLVRIGEIKDERNAKRKELRFAPSGDIFPSKLNAEELEFVGKLDTLDNLACWYRNPDKDGFYLQGVLEGQV